jgi:hypothetical protein
VIADLMNAVRPRREELPTPWDPKVIRADDTRMRSDTAITAR